jgi:phage gp37-like protein
MLSEIETALVRLIRESPLGERLRQVDSLPDLDGDSLIGRFSTDAPAAYVALGSFPVSGGHAQPKFGVALVARNSHGQHSARHGDPMLIGLLPMMDAAMSVLDGATVRWGEGQAVSLGDETLYQRGVYVGVVQIETASPVPLEYDTGSLAEFLVFHADYDIEPHASAEEHDKWLEEPPDHSTGAPDLSDAIHPREAL